MNIPLCVKILHFQCLILLHGIRQYKWLIMFVVLIMLSRHIMLAYRSYMLLVNFTAPLVGAYCYPPYLYQRDTHIVLSSSNNQVDYDQLCSFSNIKACQRVVNRSLLFQFSNESGFASELNNLLTAFTYSVANRRRLVIDGRGWNYYTFETYFDVMQGSFSPWLPYSPICFSRAFVYLTGETSNRNSDIAYLRTTRDRTGAFVDLNLAVHQLDRIRKMENKLKLQSIELKRPVAQYLWTTISTKTREIMQRMTEEANCMMNFSIAIHIRQGDKVTTEESKEIPYTAYIEGLHNISLKNGSEYFV
jgi:hypothetical protein